MNFKKLLILLNLFFAILLTGCINLSASSKPYDCDISVKSISLKISLIETAYEMYNVNIGNTSYFNENLYKISSDTAYDHYKWLKSTYDNMDDDMQDILHDMFLNYNDLDYINTVIHLDDDASIDVVIDTLINDISLNLSSQSKDDVSLFLNYFYDNSFKSYFEYNESKYIKKSKELNKKLQENKVDLNSFINKTVGSNINSDYKFVMYYNLSPIKTISINYKNNFINTITLDMSLIDIVNNCIYDYSSILFSPLKNNTEFLKICNLLEKDLKLVNVYNNTYKDYYKFSDFCLLNLTSGFSKYLEFKYFGSTYENSSYVYDLDFYKYLKSITFKATENSIKDVSINFYKSILN